MARIYHGFPKWATQQQQQETLEWLRDYATRTRVMIDSLYYNATSNSAPFVRIFEERYTLTFPEKEYNAQNKALAKQLKAEFPYIKQANAWLLSLYSLSGV